VIHKELTAILIILLLVFPVTYGADVGEEGMPTIREVYLIRHDSTEGDRVPDKLLVGVDLFADAYYKLIYKENTIRVGLLQRGPNVVDFTVAHLFRETASHTYILAVKARSRNIILQEEIKIDIALSGLDEPDVEGTETKQVDTRLSMFVKDQLVAQKTKSHPPLRLTGKSRLEPAAIDYGIYNPVNGSYPTLDSSSFSVLTLAGLAFRAIKKSKIQKRQQREIKKYSSIQTAFFREDEQGVRKKYDLTIRIEVVNRKNP
jgi:hypothetical protein